MPKDVRAKPKACFLYDNIERFGDWRFSQLFYISIYERSAQSYLYLKLVKKGSLDHPQR